MKIALDKTSYKILLSSGNIPRESLDQALKQAETSGGSFLKAVADAGIASERKILEIFSKATGHPVINLKNILPDPEIFKHIPVKFATYYKFFPIRHEGGKLVIAASRVLDIHTLDEMRFALGFEIDLCFAMENDIEEMLQKYYGLAADTVEKILSETPPNERPAAMAHVQEVEDIEKLAATPSVAHVVNQIILDAYKKRASDIHLEALTTGIRLRYRIDGLLQEAPVPKELKDFFSPMLSRIKIMSNLNVAERRLPQDGKFRVKTQDETLDLRVSFIPTAHGESAVLRILPGKNVFKLEQLGFEEKYQKLFENLLEKPNGIIFVTGPTGSGKSTTLYAALNRLNIPGRKIITIEDPVEYELDGVNQIHVMPEIGLTFSSGLRSMLRQDPDVMMVGEVRDLETADIAIRAALTGHLILSTLHTNDAAGGVTRLLDIGVEPYLIASSVVAFIAQRLVRVICSHCKEENTQAPLEIRRLIAKENGVPEANIRIYQGRGCDHCNGTGYRGRAAIHEFLILTESIRKLIMCRATAESLKIEALRQGMNTLRRSGWEKVISGVTTPEEVIEATGADIISDSENEDSKVFIQPDSMKQNDSEIKAQAKKAKDSDAPEKFTELSKENSKKIFSEKDFMDLRKFKRIRCRIPVFFRVIDFRGKTSGKNREKIAQFEFGGVIENMCPGGIFFITPDRSIQKGESGAPNEMWYFLNDALEAGNVLDLKVSLPEREKPIECMAKILRVVQTVEDKEKHEEPSYNVALMFLAINSVDRAFLEKFCQSQAVSDETV